MTAPLLPTVLTCSRLMIKFRFKPVRGIKKDVENAGFVELLDHNSGSHYFFTPKENHKRRIKSHHWVPSKIDWWPDLLCIFSGQRCICIRTFALRKEKLVISLAPHESCIALRAVWTINVVHLQKVYIREGIDLALGHTLQMFTNNNQDCKVMEVGVLLILVTLK